MALTHVNDTNFEAEVLKSPIPVLVDFFATWCGPCKALVPVLDQLAADYEGKAKIVKLDIDEAPGVASSFGIMAVPTLIVFKAGKVAQMLTGPRGRPQIESALKSAL